MRFNGARTAVLFVGLSALIVVVGGAIGGRTGLVIAFVIALATNGVAYFASDRIALSAMRARPGQRGRAAGDVPDRPRALHGAPGSRCPGSTSRRPTRPTPSPPAATRATPRSAAPRASCRSWTSASCARVLGHELTHVYNRDILISSVAGAIAAVITWIAQLAWFLPFGGADDDDGRRHPRRAPAAGARPDRGR